MKTILRPITWLPGCDTGWGNGYVLLPLGHKYHGVGYDDIPVNVHGGLTFAKEITESNLSFSEDLTTEDIGKWMIGFDTAHHRDDLESCPKEYVEAETKSLHDQLI
jgi:hypothetical protein